MLPSPSLNINESIKKIIDVINNFGSTGLTLSVDI